MFGYERGGLFLRLYYPAEKAKSEEQAVKSDRWVRWLPDGSYLPGMSLVLGLWLWLVRFVMWMVSDDLRVPAVYGAAVAPAIASAQPIKLVLLSHGLGGNRFLYTTTCIELASHGFLVAALEHRDGSACRTYYYNSEEDATADRRTFIEHLFVGLGDKHLAVRNAQVRERALECTRALDLLYQLQEGKVPHGVHVLVPAAFSLSQLIGRLDMRDVTMMGHSFGAAAALVALASEPKRLRQGVLLDTWMFPVKDERLGERVRQSLLFVNTQTFHIASNVRSLWPLLDSPTAGADAERSMYTIRHTTHESQTDSVFVVGHWLNWFMRKLGGERAHRINSALVMRYLRARTGQPPDQQLNRHERLLLQEADNFYSGLTQPWA